MTDTTSYLSRALGSDEDRPKLPWVKFAQEGDAYTFTITDKGMAPDYEYSKNPNAPKVQKTWPNGDPKEFMVVSGTLESGDEANLPVKGKLMTQAVAKAVHDAGKTDLDVGGKLWIKFTGWQTTPSGYDAKDFTAKYQPPAASSATASFLGDAAGAGDAPPFAVAPHRPKAYLRQAPDHVEAV